MQKKDAKAKTPTPNTAKAKTPAKPAQSPMVKKDSKAKSPKKPVSSPKKKTVSSPMKKSIAGTPKKKTDKLTAQAESPATATTPLKSDRSVSRKNTKSKFEKEAPPGAMPGAPGPKPVTMASPAALEASKMAPPPEPGLADRSAKQRKPTKDPLLANPPSKLAHALANSGAELNKDDIFILEHDMKQKDAASNLHNHPQVAEIHKTVDSSKNRPIFVVVMNKAMRENLTKKLKEKGQKKKKSKTKKAKKGAGGKDDFSDSESDRATTPDLKAAHKISKVPAGAVTPQLVAIVGPSGLPMVISIDNDVSYSAVALSEDMAPMAPAPEKPIPGCLMRGANNTPIFIPEQCLLKSKEGKAIYPYLCSKGNLIKLAIGMSTFIPLEGGPKYNDKGNLVTDVKGREKEVANKVGYDLPVTGFAEILTTGMPHFVIESSTQKRLQFTPTSCEGVLVKLKDGNLAFLPTEVGKTVGPRLAPETLPPTEETLPEVAPGTLLSVVILKDNLPKSITQDEATKTKAVPYGYVVQGPNNAPMFVPTLDNKPLLPAELQARMQKAAELQSKMEDEVVAATAATIAQQKGGDAKAEEAKLREEMRKLVEQHAMASAVVLSAIPLDIPTDKPLDGSVTPQAVLVIGPAGAPLLIPVDALDKNGQLPENNSPIADVPKKPTNGVLFKNINNTPTFIAEFLLPKDVEGRAMAPADSVKGQLVKGLQGIAVFAPLDGPKSTKAPTGTTNTASAKHGKTQQWPKVTSEGLIVGYQQTSAVTAGIGNTIPVSGYVDIQKNGFPRFVIESVKDKDLAPTPDSVEGVLVRQEGQTHVTFVATETGKSVGPELSAAAAATNATEELPAPDIAPGVIIGFVMVDKDGLPRCVVEEEAKKSELPMIGYVVMGVNKAPIYVPCKSKEVTAADARNKMMEAATNGAKNEEDVIKATAVAIAKQQGKDPAVIEAQVREEMKKVAADHSAVAAAVALALAIAEAPHDPSKPIPYAVTPQLVIVPGPAGTSVVIPITITNSEGKTPDNASPYAPVPSNPIHGILIKGHDETPVFIADSNLTKDAKGKPIHRKDAIKGSLQKGPYNSSTFVHDDGPKLGADGSIPKPEGVKTPDGKVIKVAEKVGAEVAVTGYVEVQQNGMPKFYMDNPAEPALPTPKAATQGVLVRKEDGTIMFVHTDPNRGVGPALATPGKASTNSDQIGAVTGVVVMGANGQLCMVSEAEVKAKGLTPVGHIVQGPNGNPMYIPKGEQGAKERTNQANDEAKKATGDIALATCVVEAAQNGETVEEAQKRMQLEERKISDARRQLLMEYQRYCEDRSVMFMNQYGK